MRLLTAGASACLVAVLAACSGSPSASAPGASHGPAVTGPHPRAAVSPLTGLPPTGRGPVVVVKIDNAPLARPYQRGLAEAAVVYVELVEGGTTRFAAVYAGMPREVGPVRSFRESDLELLAPYGPVVLGFSGAQPGVKALVRAAVDGGDVLDASYDALPRAYRPAEQRRDARNFFTVPDRLAALRPTGAAPRDIGLRFGALPAGAGTAAADVTVRYSRLARVRVVWQPGTGRYSVSSEGRRTAGAAPVNVVVQRVEERRSDFHDVNGARTPYTVTIGSGRALVLRGGRLVAATWRRTGTGPTRYLDAAGQDVLLGPGPTWVLLQPSTEPMPTG